MFQVTTPATDRTLLTLDEVKTALGVTGTAQDTALNDLLERVSDMIAQECKVPIDGIKPPTLRKETITETWRLGRRCDRSLMFSRYPVASVASISVDGATIDASTYEVDRGTGIVRRLQADEFCVWSGKIVAVYDAGYADVPEDLKLAALEVLREQSALAGRDPMLKRERVDGVGEQEYWTGGLNPDNGAPMSSGAAAMLDPYRYERL